MTVNERNMAAYATKTSIEVGSTRKPRIEAALEARVMAFSKISVNVLQAEILETRGGLLTSGTLSAALSSVGDAITVRIIEMRLSKETRSPLFRIPSVVLFL